MFRYDRLNDLMDSRGYSASDIEHLAEVSRSQIHYLQKGERPNVSAVIVAKLAVALGCSSDYLLNLTETVVPFDAGRMPPETRQIIAILDRMPHRDKWRLLVAAKLLTGNLDGVLLDSVSEFIRRRQTHGNNQIGSDKTQELLDVASNAAEVGDFAALLSLVGDAITNQEQVENNGC